MDPAALNPLHQPGRIVRPQRDQAGWLRSLPGLQPLREYQIGWLRHDIVAGLVLTTMLVPVGIAYAVASGVPGINGLYATIVPLLAYALFGPSRILVLGPDSSLAAVILAVVAPLSGGDPMRAVAIAGMMAVVSGTVCIVAGLARLGFITELLSKPIRYGYMNGIALTVLISQLPKMFGFSVDAGGPLRKLFAIAQAVLQGRANWTAFAVGAGTLVVILLLKRRQRVPGILIAVVGATVVVSWLDLAQRAGVPVIGPLPQGLPSFSIPLINYDIIVPVLIGGCAVALVSFADTSVLSRTYAARTGTYVNPNQEMVGLGVANLAAGFFQAIVIAVIEFLWDGWRPHYAVLGRVDGVEGYHDITRYPGPRLIPGLVLFRWDAPLFFANAELFQERLLDVISSSPTAVRWVVVAAEPVTSIDVTAADMLMELDATLLSSGIELCFAEMKDPVKDKLKRFGLYLPLGEGAFFPTVEAAVRKYLATQKETTLS